MMKKHLISLFAVLLVCLFVCASFAPAAAAESSGSPEAETGASAGGFDPDATPAERAAERGLPEPPDIDVTSWEYILCNQHNSIYEYIPEYGSYDGQGYDGRIVPAVEKLITDARAAGFEAHISVAYRNFEWLDTYYLVFSNSDFYGSGYEASKHFIGMGMNDHQTGLGIDITDLYMYRNSYDPFVEIPGIEGTELYSWLLEHCAEYGFILRYPEGKEMYYGLPCASTHFRYVGPEAAQYIMENNLCLEEFLMLYREVFVPANLD